MKKKIFSILLSIFLVGISLAQTNTPNRASYEQLKSIVETRSVPFWKQEINIWQNYQPKPDEMAYWKQLDAATNYQTAQAPFVLLLKPASKEQADWGINWLKREILLGRADARFSYVYAAVLWSINQQNPIQFANFKKMSFTFLANARFIGGIETRICKDSQNARMLLRGAFEATPVVRPIVEEVKKVTDAEWLQFDLEVAGLQIAIANTRLNRNYLCQSLTGDRTIDGSVDPSQKLEDGIQQLMRRP